MLRTLSDYTHTVGINMYMFIFSCMEMLPYLSAEFGENFALKREALVVRHVPVEHIELGIRHGILHIYIQP